MSEVMQSFSPSTREMEEIEIETKIIEAAKAYYLGEPIMSDEEFDELVEDLRSTDPDNPILTQVGWGMSVYGDKVKLPAPIRHSLDKVNGMENLRGDGYEYTVSYKVDGMSAIIQYENGILKLAVTRGDGTEGVNITEKMKYVDGVPEILKDRGTNTILRGEIFIPLTVFERELSEEYANPRNAVAGIMNRKSFDNLEYVRFAVHPESFSALELYNEDFHIVQGAKLRKEEFEEYYKQNKFYPTDGLVCSDERYNNIFAFKFETETAETIVVDVEYNMKRGGKLVPIIHYQPVPLYGTMCTKCTGFNYEYIKKNGIGRGAKIELTKANEIIPYITKVVAPAPEPILPDVKYKEEGVHAYVTDDVQYELSLKHFIEHHFCFLGFKRPEVIIDALELKSFADLAEWREMMRYSSIVDRLKDHGIHKLADKIADKITGDPLNSHSFFMQFAFDGLGPKAAEALQSYIDDFKSAMEMESIEAQNKQLYIICGKAGVNVTVRDIILNRDCNVIFYTALNLFDWEYKAPRGKVEDGEVKLKFIITGSLPSGRTKKKFAELVAPYGYKMVSTANQAEVVIGSPTSTTQKAQHARDKGKPLLTEDQFLERYVE